MRCCLIVSPMRMDVFLDHIALLFKNTKVCSVFQLLSYAERLCYKEQWILQRKRIEKTVRLIRTSLTVLQISDGPI